MTQHNMEDIRDTADIANSFIRRFELPPLPEVFEVFYVHTTKQNEGLSTALDRVMESPERVVIDVILSLHDRFLGALAAQNGLETIGEALTDEITQMFAHLETGLAGNTHFSNVLKESIRDLSGSRTKEELRSIARHMFKSNQSALSMSHELSQQLERSRHELDKARSELDEMRENAFTDHLTKLANRRAFDRDLAAAIDLSTACHQPLALAILDIDHFKRINDTFGHQVGDRVLQRLASLLQQNVKGRDKIARLGGEEFSLILPNTDIEGARALNEELRKLFENLVWVQKSGEEDIGQITISSGVALFQLGDTVETLVERADQQLYVAKTSGRNTVSVAA